MDKKLLLAFCVMVTVLVHFTSFISFAKNLLGHGLKQLLTYDVWC